MHVKSPWNALILANSTHLHYPQKEVSCSVFISFPFVPNQSIFMNIAVKYIFHALECFSIKYSIHIFFIIAVEP